MYWDEGNDQRRYLFDSCFHSFKKKKTSKQLRANCQSPTMLRLMTHQHKTIWLLATITLTLILGNPLCGRGL